MSFLQRFGQLLARVTRADDPRRIINLLPMPQVIAGLPLTVDSAMQVSVVWACIDAITKAISCSQWKVYQLDGRKRKYLPDDELDHILNQRPNPEITAIAWKESMLYQATTWGNSYSEIERDGRGRIIGLWPLLSDRMVPFREGNGPLMYAYMQMGGGWAYLRSDQVYHIRGPTINGLTGMEMIARAANSIGLAVAAERFASAYYANNTVVGAVLEYPKTLSQDAYDRLKKDWEEKRSGPDKAHKPLILEGGMKITTTVADAHKSQVTESRKFSVEELCRWWGVPPHKVQHLDRATFNNIEHLGIEFTRDAVTPWAERMCQEANFKFFPQRAPWRQTRIDTNWLMYGDAKTRAEANAIYRRIGVWNANEIREMEGANTIDGDGGEGYVIESTMTTMDLVVNPPKPATPQIPGESGKKAPEPGKKEAPPPQKGLPPKKKSTGELARASAVMLFTSLFERYSKRLENRQKDLRRTGKHSEMVVQSLLARERETSREKILSESEDALSLVAALAQKEKVDDGVMIFSLDDVDNGVQPNDAAEKLVAGYLRENENDHQE